MIYTIITKNNKPKQSCNKATSNLDKKWGNIMKTLISIIALICVYVAYKKEQKFYSDLKKEITYTKDINKY